MKVSNLLKGRAMHTALFILLLSVAGLKNVMGQSSQTTTFYPGWTWWSTFIEQDGIDGLAMLESGLGSNGMVIKTQCDGYAINIPNVGWCGNLQGLSNEQAYMVYCTGAAEASLTGSPAVPSEHPITLSHGWNWIGYPCNYTMDITTAFSDFTASDGDQVKSGNVYANYIYIAYGGVGIWYGSLDSIRPGMGMRYNSKNSQEVTFIYAEVGRNTGQHRDITENNHWMPNMHLYEYNMLVTGVVYLNGEEIQSEQYEVGAFVGNECRGSARPIYVQALDQYIVFLTIGGKNYFGENITFKLYDHEAGQEVAVGLSSMQFEVEGIVGLPLDDPYVFHFNPIYQVAATAIPTEGGTVSGAGEYENGTICTLTASPNMGYAFQCWTKENGPIVSTEPTFSFTVTESATYEARFVAVDNVVIGTDTQTNSYLPSYSSYNYSLTQQIYTADELSGIDTIGSISFFNEGSTKTRNYTIYMVHTDKALFSSNSDWIAVTAGDEVFSGSVTMAGGAWTTIILQTPFAYDGTSNVALIVDDNTGRYSSGMSCRVFDANGSQSIRIYSDGTNYNPYAPTNYYGTRLYVKNCIVLGASVDMQAYTISVTASPDTGGVVEGGGIYLANTTAILTATPTDGGTFINWTEDGTQVSTNPVYTFIATSDRTLTASFTDNPVYCTITATVEPSEWGTISGTGTYLQGQTCTLTATANEGYAFINWMKDGETVSTSASYSFAVTESAAFVAHFGEQTDITQATNFAQGWNWWSTYVEQEGIDGLSMLEESLGTSGITIKSQNGYVQYMPDYSIWYGSQNMSVTNETFYMIQTTAACDVEITGLQANPANHPITLATGWNWIGYPCTSHMSFANAFSGITPSDGDQVKSQGHGFASYMEAYGIWYGTLADYGIDPGMGLMYKSNNGSSFSFTYPNGRNEGETTSYTAENTHWTANYNAYPNNMTVTAVVELDDVELVSDNYELAAFANGECRGSVRLMYVAPLNRYMAFLTVAGEDATDINFSLYDTETETVVETVCTPSLQYETNAIVASLETPYVIRFRSTTGVDDWTSSLNIFPNPVARGQQFTIGLTADEIGKVQIEIVNALGAVETLRATSVQTITAPIVAGVYTLRITVEGKGTCYRKLVVR